MLRFVPHLTLLITVVAVAETFSGGPSHEYVYRGGATSQSTPAGPWRGWDACPLERPNRIEIDVPSAIVGPGRLRLCLTDEELKAARK